MTLMLLLACERAPSIDVTPYAGVFVQLDKDGDGTLSEAEYLASAPPVFTAFAKADLDADGALSRAELAQLVHHTDPANYDPALVPRRRVLPGRRGTTADPAAAESRGKGTGFDGSGPPFDEGVGGAGGGGAPPNGRPSSKFAGHPTVGDPSSTAESRRAAVRQAALEFEAAEILAADPQAVLPAPGASPDEAVATLKAHALRLGLAWPEALETP